MPLAYQAPQYVSSFVPQDMNLIASALKQRQERKDQIDQAFAQTQAKLNEVSTYHPELMDQVMGNLKQGFNQLYSQTGGDVSANYDQFLTYIANARSDPFWQINEAYNEQMKREDAARAEAQSKGRVLDFETLRGKKLIDPATGKYINKDALQFDVQPQLPWSEQMMSTWNYALQEESSSWETPNNLSGTINKGSRSGIDQKQLDNKRGKAWSLYAGGSDGKGGTPEFYQQKRWYVKQALDVNPNLTKAEAEQIAVAQIQDEFYKAGQAKLHKSTSQGIDYIPGFNAGGGNTAGIPQINQKGFVGLDTWIKGKSAYDLNDITPDSPAYGMKVHTNEAVMQIPSVNNSGANVRKLGEEYLTRAKGMPNFDPKKYPLIVSGHMVRDPQAYGEQLRNLAEFIGGTKAATTFTPGKTKETIYDPDTRKAEHMGAAAGAGDNPTLDRAEEALKVFKVAYDAGFNLVKEKGATDVARTYGFNMAYGRLSDINASSTAMDRLNLDFQTAMSAPNALTDVYDIYTDKTLASLNVNPESIKILDAGATPEGMFIDISYRESGQGENTSPKATTIKIGKSGSALNIKEHNVMQVFDNALNNAFSAAVYDQTRVGVNQDGQPFAYDRQSGRTNDAITQDMQQAGVQIKEQSTPGSVGNIQSFAFYNNDGSPVTMNDLMKGVINLYRRSGNPRAAGMTDAQLIVEARQQGILRNMGLPEYANSNDQVQVTSSYYFNNVLNALKNK